jgi:hypothetical protein
MIAREQGRRRFGTSTDVIFGRLIRQSISPWKKCAADYFEEVKRVVTEALDELCRLTFRRYTKSGLYPVVK